LLSACGSARYAGTVWDGRRGYDGNGDYGYDLAASRAEARDYRASAARSYQVPGSADDPWGPYIRDAAARYHVPQRWIRAVMQQESGGQLYASDGSLTISSAGAMGLMQVMPRTYDTLRQHYGLGDDPYDPHDNILAGAAYIHEMYGLFGAPGFLAAYNAGPDRLNAYLADGTPLPDETVNYVASIAPNLGTKMAMTGPLAMFAGNTALALQSRVRLPPTAADRAYAGGGMTGTDYDASAGSVAVAGNEAGDIASSGDGRADRAYDGGGLATAAAPTGIMQQHSSYADSAAAGPPSITSRSSLRGCECFAAL